MKILKHGNPDIIKNWTTTFTCTRCECEFEVNFSDLTADSSVQGVDLFIRLLDNPNDLTDVLIYKTYCPECGQELSKTKDEVNGASKKENN